MTTLFLHVEPMLWGACLWYWLWTLGAFLLGAFLAWLLGRDTTEPVDTKPIIADRDRYHAAATKWEKDYNSVKYQMEEAQKAEADLRTSLANCKADKHLLEQEIINTKATAAAAFAAGTGAGAAGNAALSGIAGAGNDQVAEGETFGFPEDAESGSKYDGLFERDNLQIIEGVGPKVHAALTAAGFTTWDEVASATPEDLKAALTASEGNFALADPTSWPHQAKLAAAGEWDDLIKYQHFTDAGRETVGDLESNSKFEHLANKELEKADSTAARIIPAPVSPYFGLFKTDNFQIIEGVGPKVNQVLLGAGYKEWSDLAAADSDDLRRVLQDAGSNYALSDPTSWPHQASLAAAGDWDELIRYQKFTDGGRETVGDFESDSKFEKLAARQLGFSSNNPNDLKVVEGIGPKIEGLLKDVGITNWAELSAADPEALQSILDAAGPRYKMARPLTWPQQAALAAAGDWSALKALQDELDGGN